MCSKSMSRVRVIVLVCTYFPFYSHGTYILSFKYKCSVMAEIIMTNCQFLHDDDNADSKAIAIPRVFSENSRAKNRVLRFCAKLLYLGT